jgi:hypothetical protein
MLPLTLPHPQRYSDDASLTRFETSFVNRFYRQHAACVGPDRAGPSRLVPTATIEQSTRCTASIIWLLGLMAALVIRSRPIDLAVRDAQDPARGRFGPRLTRFAQFLDSSRPSA